MTAIIIACAITGWVLSRPIIKALAAYRKQQGGQP